MTDTNIYNELPTAPDGTAWLLSNYESDSYLYLVEAPKDKGAEPAEYIDRTRVFNSRDLPRAADRILDRFTLGATIDALNGATSKPGLSVVLGD